MKNKKIINRLIDYYLEGSELTKKEHNTVRSLKEKMQAINYKPCCTELCDEENSAYNLQNNTRLCDWCHKEFK